MGSIILSLGIKLFVALVLVDFIYRSNCLYIGGYSCKTVSVLAVHSTTHDYTQEQSMTVLGGPYTMLGMNHDIL